MKICKNYFLKILIKRLGLGLIIGLLSVSVFAQNFKKGTIIESNDEISCSSFNYIQFAAKGIEMYQGDEYGKAGFSGWISNADCSNLTEGIDLKIIKFKSFDRTYAGMSKGILVKLPTGMTTWVAR